MKKIILVLSIILVSVLCVISANAATRIEIDNGISISVPTGFSYYSKSGSNTNYVTSNKDAAWIIAISDSNVSLTAEDIVTLVGHQSSSKIKYTTSIVSENPAIVKGIDSSNIGMCFAFCSGKKFVLIQVSTGNKSKGLSYVESIVNNGINEIQPQLPVRVTSLSTSKSSVTLYQRQVVADRDKLDLKVNIQPSNASNKNVVWSSSTPTIASVNANGKITAVKKGTAIITATLQDGDKTWKATCKVTVKKIAKATSITAKPKRVTLKAGKKATVTLTFRPAGVYSKKVKWSTSDKTIAKVSSKGVITAKKKGKCVITATATDGSKKKVSITVTVK